MAKEKEKNYVEADSLVSCSYCKCVLFKNDAHEVLVYDASFASHSVMTFGMYSRGIEKETKYYCQSDKVGYKYEFKVLGSPSIYFTKLEEMKSV